MPTFTAAFPVIFNSVTVAKSNVSPEVGVVISQVTSCSGSGSGSGSGSVPDSVFFNVTFAVAIFSLPASPLTVNSIFISPMA